LGEKKIFTKQTVLEGQKARLKPPPLYMVLMHNDDYTTMDFVVEVLQRVFSKLLPEANRIMLNIHNKGVGLCGTYPFEVAETKVAQVHSMAKEAGFPLHCSLKET
jgi:ATP-dependent Clp protease adaptor protein ClpS